uniref:Uncharacterized protein n=1 Tax=Romanomermis culicivorax TaxID=13658 RepID=A0A915IF31_ROMCU
MNLYLFGVKLLMIYMLRNLDSRGISSFEALQVNIDPDLEISKRQFEHFRVSESKKFPLLSAERYRKQQKNKNKKTCINSLNIDIKINYQKPSTIGRRSIAKKPDKRPIQIKKDPRKDSEL